MASATITSKGQVTIPKVVRDTLGLREGDRLDFVVQSDGSVTIRPATVDLLSLDGVLKPRRKGVTLEDMEEAIRKGATRGFRRR